MRGAAASLAIAAVVACSSDEGPGGGTGATGGQGGSAGTSAPMAGKGGGAMGGSAGTGASGGAGGSGNAGTGGTSMTGGNAGMLSAGGSSTGGLGGTAGMGAGQGGGAGTTLGGAGGAGGVAAGAGTGAGGQGGAMAGAAGSGMAGAGGGSALHGGASGKYVCTPGATYGNPLTGMGSVGMVGPPTQGTPNYFAFIEGPIWIASLGKLFFSDNASPERIWVLTPGMAPSVFQEMSKSNGLALDGDDKLVVAQQVDNLITRVDPTASSPVQTQIKAAGCKPNDVVVRSDGNIYYSAPNGNGTGFYRLSPAGMLTGPRTDVMAPNGIVLSPDENTLYVGDVQNKSITKFAVAADGTVAASGTPFATTMSGTVDGMCVDCAGNVYAGTSNGVEVFSPDGMPIGIVPTGESSNCTFGGTDRKTLYVTSRSVLKTVTLAVPGLPD